MRHRLRILPPTLAILLCTACAALWLWSLSDVQYLHANFWHGSFRPPSEWRGHYLGVYYCVNSDGSLHTLRFAFPLWAALLLSSLPLLDSAGRRFLRRRRRGAVPVTGQNPPR